MQAFLLYICLHKYLTTSILLWQKNGVQKLQQNKVPRKTYDLIRYDELEKVYNLIILKYRVNKKKLLDFN